MRENEKIKNREDERRHIFLPVYIAAGVIVFLIGLLIFFGIKQPVIFNNVRDFIITFVLFINFIIGIVLAVVFILLIIRIRNAKGQIDVLLTDADGKVEDLAEKITVILKNLLEPFIAAESKRSGILQIFKGKKTEK